MANSRFPRIEGTYHIHSARYVATDIWPTVEMPSIGPSIQVSVRTSIRVSPTVTNARIPRPRRAFHPVHSRCEKSGSRGERHHIQLALTSTLRKVAAAQQVTTPAKL